MTSHRLRLFADSFAAKAAVAAPLAAVNRVFYVTGGMATVTTPGAVATLAANSAFYSNQTAEVAAGALRNLGKGPIWVAGEQNRVAAQGLNPVPRVAAINGMSLACSQLYDLPHAEAKGVDFAELD